MAMTNHVAAIVALVVIGVLVAIAWWAKLPDGKHAQDALPVAHLGRLKALPRYQELQRRHIRELAWTLAGLGLAVASLVVMVARPVTMGPDPRERATRDIVLCLDVSGSMTELDATIIRDYADLADDLAGERIAFVAFDSAAITVFPLTDDADFIRSELARFAERLGTPIPGTQAGESGTSLIGDGLASCVDRFDLLDENRSRTVVFATDNELSGEPIFTLHHAVERAMKRDIMIFGVAPVEAPTNSVRKLTDEVERTGGKVLVAGLGGDTSRITSAVASQQAVRARTFGEYREREVTWPLLGVLGGVLVSVVPAAVRAWKGRR